ncbi:MAG: hypothetical protein RIS64_2726 [Bacteroidota bacterium]|jgi:hypothetical protein
MAEKVTVTPKKGARKNNTIGILDFEIHNYLLINRLCISKSKIHLPKNRRAPIVAIGAFFCE